MKWISALVWLHLSAFCAGANVSLTSDGELVAASLAFDTTTRLLTDGLTNLSSHFIVPQCHANQHNFTFIEALMPGSTTGVEGHLPFTPVGSAKETGSSVGTVVVDGRSSLSIINTEQNSTIDVYCTYASYGLSSTYNTSIIFHTDTGYIPTTHCVLLYSSTVQQQYSKR